MPRRANFSVLGPLRVGVDGTSIRLAGLRQEKLLSALLLEAGRAVTLPRLIKVAWNGNPPATASRQVQDLITQLRRTLTAAGWRHDALATVRQGYRLDLQPRELDLATFRELVDTASQQADPLAAIGQLSEALALWTGRPFEGLDSDALEPAIASLDDERMSVWEMFTELRLAQGMHHLLTGELAAVARAHPLRERPTELLMTAMERCGRRAEAVELYHTMRRHLADELGIDPSAVLQGRYEGMLRLTGAADAPAEPRPPMPAQLPPDISRIAGRAAQLRCMEQLVAQGQGRILVVTGAPGVGKTALAIRFAHSVAARGSDGQLFVDLGGFGPGRWVESLDALGYFLRALGISKHQLPHDVAEASALLRTNLTGRKVVMVLDNAGSADQVRPLLPGGDSLVIVTSRYRLPGLTAADDAYSLQLDELGLADAADLLGGLIGERAIAQPAATASLARLCGGLPLALRIAAAQVIDDPSVSVADHVEALRAGDSLRLLELAGDGGGGLLAAFGRSYEALTDDAKGLFRELSLAEAPEFTGSAVAAQAGLSASATADLLAQLSNANLVQRRGPGRFGLHDLLRRYSALLAAMVGAACERSPEDIRNFRCQYADPLLRIRLHL